MQSSRPAAPARPSQASRNPNDEFGERLRAQREAAERLVQQRLAAARQKAQEPQKPASNGDARPAAAPTAPSEDKPRFSFADEEIAAAKRETPPSAFAPISPPPYSGPNASYVRPARGEQPRSGEGFNRPPPSSSYVPPRQAPAPFPAGRPEAPPAAAGPYRPAAAPPSLGTPEPRQARDPEALRANRPSPRRPDIERRTPPRRGAHARELDYIEDDLDEVFEDERPARRPVSARRAKASDYTAAYRGYDEDDYEEDEPRGRSGPIILLLALLAVAAIAAGLIYWYKQQQQAAAPATETGDVPVVTSPQEPAKTVPEPEQNQQTAPQTPQGRKQIYDRILGEETLEPERIVPTEEQPQQPPAPQQQQLQQQQVPPPNPDPNAQQNQQGSEPLPLPLPPPPGTGEQGRLNDDGRQTANRQVPEPASSNSLEGAEKPTAQDSDLTETSSLPDEPEQAETATAPRKPAPKAVQKATETPAKPHKRQTETARAANDEPQALQGNGPVQIAPQPLGQQQSQTQQSYSFNPPPQALQQAPEPAPAPRGRRGREDDPLAGTRTPFTGTFQSSQPEPVGRIASTEQDQPAVFQQAVQTQPAPQPQRTFQQPPAQTAPQAQQQVAVAAPQAPVQGEASGYVVQLASFRSEAEAQSEFQRLSQRHPSLVGGMGSRIERSDLGAAGTFYRLRVGPMSTKEAATQFCSSLISAGEKDCLVRRQ